MVLEFEKFTNFGCKLWGKDFAQIQSISSSISNSNSIQYLLSLCTEICLKHHSWYLVDVFGPLHFNGWNLVDSHGEALEDNFDRDYWYKYCFPACVGVWAAPLMSAFSQHSFLSAFLALHGATIILSKRKSQKKLHFWNLKLKKITGRYWGLKETPAFFYPVLFNIQKITERICGSYVTPGCVSLTASLGFEKRPPVSLLNL